jgi:hypothetical protein
MKHILCSVVLLFGMFSLAQQQNAPSAIAPPQGTPPTFPGQTPRQEIPPDQEAPVPSSGDVQQQIQKNLNSNPGMQNANVKVVADESVVLLTGKVVSEDQHHLALQIAESFAGERTIVDKIQLQQQT